MNGLKVELLKLEDLTEEETEEYGGDDWVNYLRVTYDGNTIMFASDQMEPEDASFNRDLGWIPLVIELAYNAGLKDGKDEMDK